MLVILEWNRNFFLTATVFRKSPHFLLKKYNEPNSVADHKRAPTKLLGSKHIRFMDQAKEANPELHGMLTEKFLNVRVSNKYCEEGV